MNEPRERTWGMVAHLSSLVGYSGLGFAGATILAPLVVWLIKKDESEFLDRQGREAINFNISFVLLSILAMIVGGIFALVTFGLGAFLLFPVALLLGAYHIGFSILAGIRANEGVEYRYPLTIRFLGPGGSSALEKQK